MRGAKLFLVTMAAGCAGGVSGAMLGAAVAPGGLILGGLLGGAACVVGAAYLAAARRWIAPEQRPWAIAGGALGYAVACLVVLSTLGSNGPLVSVLLIGLGAVLGAVLGSAPRAPRGRRAGDAKS